MSCTEFTVKYVLFFFNLIVVLAGVTFIGLGIAVLVNINQITDLIPVIDSIPIVLIVAGAIIFLVAFSGCCGAIRENGCLLILYAVFMLLLAAGKIALTVVIFNNLNGLVETVTKWVEDAFRNSGETIDGQFRALEEIFGCCGTVGVASYDHLNFIPPTCCLPAPGDTCTAFYDGCNVILSEYLERYGNIFGYTLIVVIFLELLAMFSAFYLNHKINKAKRVH